MILADLNPIRRPALRRPKPGAAGVIVIREVRLLTLGAANAVLAKVFPPHVVLQVFSSTLSKNGSGVLMLFLRSDGLARIPLPLKGQALEASGSGERLKG